MGMNYYIKLEEFITKESSDEPLTTLEEWLNYTVQPKFINIGLSSAGWKFLFDHHDWKYYSNVEELKEWLKNHTIFSEYGDTCTFDEFWEKVQSKQNLKQHEGRDYVTVDGYDFRDFYHK